MQDAIHDVNLNFNLTLGGKLQLLVLTYTAFGFFSGYS